MATNFLILLLIFSPLLVKQTDAQAQCAAIDCVTNTSCVECAVPTGCRPSCANPIGLHSCPKFTCSVGCVCAANYVLNAKGLCVKLSDCPAIEISETLYAATDCGVNERYYTCKPYANSCENPQVIYPPCSEDPVFRGCACISGYVRNTRDGNACVPVNSEACVAQRNGTII